MLPLISRLLSGYISFLKVLNTQNVQLQNSFLDIDLF